MAKETRDIKQYKVSTLYENVEVVISKNAKTGEKKQEKRLAVAIFDDAKLLAKYQKEQKKSEGHKSYEVVEDWVEYEPEQSRFSLSLNPEPNAVSEAETAPAEDLSTKDEEKDNGTD